ncbi:MAG: transcriptional regulator, AraC family with amidase-like domain [Geminicoccaceae bacterium]|jgi:transcriptional regulator GlxA family with amidase domain|nr:transcriptional regulator, AraC family with amidase-like domain [Geminicoccaceae bacterium]
MTHAFSGKAVTDGPIAPLTPARPPNHALRVGILAVPEITGAGIFGMYDLFAHVNLLPRLDGRKAAECRRIELTIVAPRQETMQSATGLAIVPQRAIAEAIDLDLVCVPNLDLPTHDPVDRYFPPEVLDWLRARYSSGATLAAACSGSMLLAEAGLLDGAEATTHCYYAPLFRQRYPRVSLKADKVLVVSRVDQRIVTGGGASTWADLALYLIARFCGGAAAVQIAKLFLLNWHPEGQRPYATSMLTQLQHSDVAVRRAQEWLTQNYSCPNPVGSVVAQSGMAERTFKRRFRAATGFAPLEYVQSLRLEAACELLEGSEEPVEEIAYRVGYEDITFFRRLFRRQKGVTPAEYRRRFRAIHLGAL